LCTSSEREALKTQLWRWSTSGMTAQRILLQGFCLPRRFYAIIIGDQPVEYLSWLSEAIGCESTCLLIASYAEEPTGWSP